jgi:hypothetical protein
MTRVSSIIAMIEDGVDGDAIRFKYITFAREQTKSD